MVPRLDALPPVNGDPDALAALLVPSTAPATDAYGPDSDDYAERSTLHLSDIGGLTVETIGRPLP